MSDKPFLNEPYSCFYWETSNINITHFITSLQETVNKWNIYKGQVLLIVDNTENIMQGKFDLWTLD